MTNIYDRQQDTFQLGIIWGVPFNLEMTLRLVLCVTIYTQKFIEFNQNFSLLQSLKHRKILIWTLFFFFYKPMVTHAFSLLFYLLPLLCPLLFQMLWGTCAWPVSSHITTVCPSPALPTLLRACCWLWDASGRASDLVSGHGSCLQGTHCAEIASLGVFISVTPTVWGAVMAFIPLRVRGQRVTTTICASAADSFQQVCMLSEPRQPFSTWQVSGKAAYRLPACHMHGDLPFF